MYMLVSVLLENNYEIKFDTSQWIITLPDVKRK